MYYFHCLNNVYNFFNPTLSASNIVSPVKYLLYIDIYCAHFSISIDTFFEAKQYNSCLNRKLFIDSNGNIKNCPSSKQIYGNVQDTTLKSIIENPKFKDIWLINKDKIDVCKDCEFRYMCTDCRCFLKQSNNLYSQPYMCTYNPYIALWESENGYVPVEECGTFDKNFKFIPNHEKILLLNQKIWNND